MKAITPHHTIYPSRFFARLRLWLCMSLVLLTTGPLWALNASHYASRSQLADGLWVKIAVYESGIHQITYRELSKWGFSNPSAVTVFGYGGAMLPADICRRLLEDSGLKLIILTCGTKGSYVVAADKVLDKLKNK